MLRWLAAFALCASTLVSPARADLSNLIADCGGGHDFVKSTIACTKLIEDEKPDKASLQTAYERLGYIQSRMGDHQRALDYYQTAQTIWPTDPRFLAGMAGALNGLKKHDLAIKAASAAIKADATAAAYDQRGRAQLAKGEPAKALPDFRKASELDPNDVFILANAGFALSELGRHDEALAFFNRALAIEDDWDNWSDGLLVRSKMRLRMGQPDLAVADCKRAAELNAPNGRVKTECPPILSAAAAMPRTTRTPDAPAPAPAPAPVVARPAPSTDEAALAPAPLRRVALVIGNATYENVSSLRNPGPDASAVAAKLREKGFEVTHEQDVGRRKLISTIDGFLTAITTKSQVVVYYAGHGVELDGANYIVPTDVPALSPDAEALIKDNAVNLSSLLVEIGRRKAAATVVILDACRDNPFRGVKVAGLTRSLRARDGLAAVAAPSGVYVMFSAGVNQEALDRLSFDDPDPNGLFTRRLLRLMDVKGLELRAMSTRLRREVSDLAKTSRITNPDGHEQSPAAYDQMNGDFYFTPADEG